MKENFVDFLTDISQIGNDKMQYLLGYQFELFLLEKDEENRILLRQKSYDFFSGLRAYCSQFLYIIGNNFFNNSIIKFIDVNYKEKMINPNSLLYDDIDHNQKIIYQSFINYPYVHKAIIEGEVLLQKDLRYHLRLVEKIILYFGITIIITHIIFVYIWLQFVNKYKNIFEHNYSKIIYIITNKNYLNATIEILSSLKQLLNLYEKKPDTLIISIFNERKKYKS